MRRPYIRAMCTAAPLPDPVNLACDMCGRAGRYSRARFVAIAGTDNAPDARLRFAAALGCEKARRQTALQMLDRCGVHYVGMGAA